MSSSPVVPSLGAGRRQVRRSPREDGRDADVGGQRHDGQQGYGNPVERRRRRLRGDSGCGDDPRGEFFFFMIVCTGACLENSGRDSAVSVFIFIAFVVLVVDISGGHGGGGGGGGVSVVVAASAAGSAS